MAEESRQAMEFADALLQRHAYILNHDDRKALDKINRALREGDHASQKGTNDEEKAKGIEKRTLAVERLAKWFEDVDGIVKTSLSDHGVEPPIVGPHELDGDTGAILLRIDSGGEGRSFRVAEVNWSKHGWHINLECEPAGVTYALIGMTRMPVKRFVQHVVLTREGKEHVTTRIDVRTPRMGRLAVNVKDERGKPTPFMMTITSKRTGEDKRPSPALDFATQFDNEGRKQGEMKHAALPGKLRRVWWPVPHDFDMALSPGDYEIAIRRGIEHLPIFETVSVKSDETTTRHYTIERWVDMRQIGWYSGDDHVHCQILSDDDAERLMAWVRAEDIHLANVVKMGDIFRTWFEQRGFGKEYRVVHDDYILSPGQECPRTHGELGHTISMNTTEMVRDIDKYYLYDWVADTVHEQGGLWGYAHVDMDRFSVHRDMSMNVPKGKADFAEVLQFAHLGTPLWYAFLNSGFKITAAAGSDVPWGGTIGEVRMYGYVGDEPFTADAWFEAVRRGNTFVTNGPMIDLRVDSARPGDELLVKEKRKLRVSAKAWSAARDPVVRLEIIKHGEVIKHVDRQGDGAPELTIDLEIDAGHGFWLAAHAYTLDTAKAHTTPIYVVREGLRFWKYDEAPALLEKGLANLDEVEQIVAEAQAKHEAGELDGDQTKLQLAIQGPALLQRVEEARQIFRDLQETHEQEKARRVD